MFYANSEEKQNTEVLIEKYNKLSNLGPCNDSTSEDSISISEDKSIIENSILDLLDTSFNKDRKNENVFHSEEKCTCEKYDKIDKLLSERPDRADRIERKDSEDAIKNTMKEKEEGLSLQSLKQKSVKSLSSDETQSRSPDPKEISDRENNILPCYSSGNLTCSTSKNNLKEVKERTDSTDKLKFESLEYAFIFIIIFNLIVIVYYNKVICY